METTSTLKELMNEISQLQKTEEQLYVILDKNAENVALGREPTMSDTEINAITTQINSLTSNRVSLYNSLSAYYKNEIVLEKSVQKSLDQQTQTLQLLESELNKAKQNLAKQEDDRYNQLKMIEINSYFSKQYDAHIKLMRLITIVGLCMLGTLLLNYVEPLKVVARPLFNLVLLVGIFLIIKVIIDMYLRRNDNYDEYTWPTAPSTEEDVNLSNTQTNTTDISGIDLPFCYGSNCCSTGTVWDATSYTCVLDTNSTPK
jgi:hypothetical protein